MIRSISVQFKITKMRSMSELFRATTELRSRSDLFNTKEMRSMSDQFRATTVKCQRQEKVDLKPKSTDHGELCGDLLFFTVQ